MVIRQKGPKRYFVIALLEILCLGSLPVSVASRSYQTIKEIAENTPSRWQGEYTSVRNETVSVDCPITVPDVEKAPVLRAAWYPTLDPAFVEAFDSDIKSWSDATSAVFVNKWTSLISSDLSLDEYQYIETFIPLEDVDWDHAYCQNNSLTPREAFDALQMAIEKIYTQYGNAGYYPMQPAHGITVARLEDAKGNPLWDMGIYDMEAYQLVRGIPILGHASQSYAETQRFESIYSPRYYLLQIQSKDSYLAGAHLMNEEELLFDDIPLIGFEEIQPRIEKLIEAGRVRKVHRAHLGYVLYFEPDHNLKHFRLMPAWVVECDYFKSAKVEADLYVDTLDVENGGDYRLNARYRKLIFNAQTGEMLDPENTARNRCDYPKVITWKQAKK